MKGRFILSEHPLARQSLSILRDKRTGVDGFRRHMRLVGALLGYEVFRGLKMKPVTVSTPLGPARGAAVEEPVVLVAVLRAGLGLLEGVESVAPEARVGHIGLYRDERTLKPVHYYVKLPPDLSKSFVVLCDPMLATGGSAADALRLLKDEGARKICLVSLIAAKPGVSRVQRAHPDVDIYAAGLDARLNDVGFILPGLGDAGDRLYGT